MSSSKIAKIHGRQILDSRGNPTVEADVWTESGHFGRAAVPSGASTGSKEALEMRDGDKSYYMGKSVEQAVGRINTEISNIVMGLDACDQKKVDMAMIEADGTENKSSFGANAILAVSLATCRAGANYKNRSLYQYMREELNAPFQDQEYVLPSPLMNIINGGEHASNNLDIQEFMIVPHMKKSFGENLRAGVECFHALKKVLTSEGYSTNVGDEGGFAPNLKSHEEALDLILKSIENAGYRPGEDISLSLDAAASEFYRDGKYHMQGKEYRAEEMIEYYRDLSNAYPIYSIEDGLDEGDNQGWTKLTAEIGNKVLMVGDDLFVTNKKILKEGIENKRANSILIKVNQIGSLTETFETMALGYENDFKSIISHRSGETGDSFIADLAVATNSGHIKTGSASRSDRMEKYNQLLRIEEQLGDRAVFIPVR